MAGQPQPAGGVSRRHDGAVIGGARLLETAAGIPYDTGLLIFGISIALYTAFGGFRASVLNDAMQGLVMLLGTVLLLVAVIHAAGGLDSAVHKLQQIDPALVSPQGGDRILSLPFMASFWIPVCFGVIGLPHTAVRCISYKRQQGCASRHSARHRGGGGADVRHAPAAHSAARCCRISRSPIR